MVLTASLKQYSIVHAVPVTMSVSAPHLSRLMKEGDIYGMPARKSASAVAVAVSVAVAVAISFMVSVTVSALGAV